MQTLVRVWSESYLSVSILTTAYLDFFGDEMAGLSSSESLLRFSLRNHRFWPVFAELESSCGFDALLSRVAESQSWKVTSGTIDSLEDVEPEAEDKCTTAEET